MSRAGAIAAAVGLAALAGARGGATPEVDEAPPAPSFVLITIDTLRADHLGCYGYFRDTSPQIDALAAESVRFTAAYAPMATTLPSHLSLFTGLYPAEHGVLANVSHTGRSFDAFAGVRLFAAIARKAGFTTAAFVSALPVKRITGLAEGFAVYDQPAGYERPARVTTDRALAWLKLRPRPPFLLWVHYFDPHTPRRPPPEHLGRYRADAALERYLAERRVHNFVVGETACVQPTEARVATNRYDEEVRAVDDQIGRLMGRLRALDLLEQSAVVLTADHGEGLNQHGWPGHGRVHREQVRVPLLIRFPAALVDRAALPERVDAVVSLVDVLPTVLGRFDAPWAAPFLEQASGTDVLAADFAPRPVLSRRSGRDCGDGLAPLYALTTPEWRFVYAPESRHRLYSRRDDPHELRDLAEARPAETAALRRTTEALLESQAGRARRFGPARKRASRPLPPGILEQLEALGYGVTPEAAGGGAAGGETRTAPDAADPPADP